MRKLTVLLFLLASIMGLQAKERTIECPSNKEIISSFNDELLLRIEANKKESGFTINEVGDVSDEDLFASMISKHRGKVILVDFWATWCGPCRQAMKSMLPMKEDLKDKEIVYLYIAGENSPKATWDNMITDIHGEHVRVTAAQWSYLSKNLKINGVPTYFGISKTGEIMFKETGFPGVAKMKEQLLKELDK